VFDFTFGIDEAARKAARYSIISGLPLLVLVVLDTRMKPDPLQLDSTQDDEENVRIDNIDYNLVEEYGYELEYASDNLKNNPEIVLAAIKTNIDTLEYASNDLKNDREFILSIYTSVLRFNC
jgi:hypothetical protein